MMTSEHIINVSEADFEYQVLAYSQKMPVVVDFWAEWCIPCRTLDPMLEKLAIEAQGAFRLARLNVDANPKLAQSYNVSSIPAVKAFRNGKVVAEFSGLVPEPKLREFMRGLSPSSIDLLLEKANSYYTLEQWQSAEQSYREILQKSPSHTAALLGLVKCLMMQGCQIESMDILKRFPASREYQSAQQLMQVASAVAQPGEAEAWNEEPLENAYNRALRLIRRGSIPTALDVLLDILRQDKHFHQGQVRQIILGLLELLGESNSLTSQYRQELASILF